MLQLTRDLGLQQEARPALRLAGVAFLDLLEGDLSVEFLVAGHEDLAQAAPGVRPQDAKAGKRAGGIANDLGGGGIGIELRAVRGDMHQAGLHVRVGDLLEVLAYRVDRADRGQAPLRIVAVLFQMFEHHRFQQTVFLLGQSVLLLKELSDGFRLVKHPGMHGSDERIPRDEIHLQGEDTE
jgi:hypothetical protein